MFNTVLNVVPQGKVAVVERFGEFHAAKQPGLFFAIPLATLMKSLLYAWPRRARAEENRVADKSA